MLSDVSCIIDGIPVDIGDWSCSSQTNLGFDQMRGSAPAAQLRAIGGIGQGSDIALYAADGENAIWAGRLATEPRYVEGRGEITARGYGYDAVKRHSRRLFQSRDYSQWGPANADGNTTEGGGRTYDDYKKIQAENTEGRLMWTLPNQNYSNGTDKRAGFRFHAPGADLSRVAFTMNSGDDSGTNDFEFQVCYATGPAGAATVSEVYVTSAGNMGTAKDHTLDVTTEDMVLIFLRCTSGSTPLGDSFRFFMNDVRVNGLTTSDTYLASQVVSNTATALSFDGGGVTASTVLDNVLPLDWVDASWADMLTYVAELEDWRWRALDDRGSGPYVEYGPYDSKVWTTYLDVCSPSLLPLEVYNQVEVKYNSPAGAELTTTVSASPDPLAAKGLTNVYEFEITDAQPNATMATAVATALAARVSTQRYTGTVDIGHAWDERGKDAPREIVAGDTLRIADFDDATSIDLRITDVEQTPDSVSVSTEDFLPIDAMLAQLISVIIPEEKKKKRRRKRRRR